MISPTTMQRTESAAIAILAITALILLGLAWWWPVALFLLFDLSMVGYFKNSVWGARTYNLGHSYFVPALLGVACAILAESGHSVTWLAIVSFSWIFHVAVDRSLGYGLKHPDSFSHTHLGTIGSTPSTR